MIQKCLIIAAGQGSRIQENRHNLPKPLLPLCGLTLLERNILCAKKAGIREFFIVIGFRGNEIKAALNPEKLGVQITFIENSDWDKPNGVSVLKAEPFLQESFVLLMSDHIFQPEALADLIKEPLPARTVRLAVDPRLETIFDMEDATKVQHKENRIQSIGKNLDSFNAVDTGLFACTPAMFEVLHQASQTKPPSLTDGMKILSKEGRLHAHPLTKFYWQDVDTPESYRYAGKMLLQSCRKQTDGVVSRNFNRTISLFVSKWLVRTPISANVITVLTTLLGLSTYVLMATGQYFWMSLGAIVFKLVSVLDGVDGEIARLKMTQSKLGAWLDTLSDNATYIAFLFGLFVGLRHRGHIYWYNFTVTTTVVGILLALITVAVYVHRNTGSGSLVDIKGAIRTPWILKFFGPLMKRDLFSVLFLVAALLNMPEAILYMTLLGTNATWIIVWAQKPDLFSRQPVEAEAKTKPIL